MNMVNNHHGAALTSSVARDEKFEKHMNTIQSDISLRKKKISIDV